MKTYYLRVEGVNLSSFIEDTEDLSTIRGGSLVLLNTVHQIKTLVKSVELRPISLGASTGLFRFEATRDVAEEIRQSLTEAVNREQSLNGTPVDLKHATFVVDIRESTGDYVRDREALRAKNRWKQMRQPRLAIPAWNGKRNEILPCTANRLRPGTETMVTPKQKIVPVSVSVKERRAYGHSQKQHFYEEHSGIRLSGGFVNDLDELTSDEDLAGKKRHGNLHHKMAVIYLDGNGFGKVQQECRTPEEQSKFDSTLRGYQRQALDALLAEMKDNPDWISAEDNYQLETLLWGGDEICWVTPAWQGWRTLQIFYQISKAWGLLDAPLTHAGGLVFCHHKAPIHRITRLARELAEKAKSKSRNQSLFAYEILESFDHTGSDMDRIRRARLPRNADLNTLILSGDGMDDAAKAFDKVKEFLPRRQVYRIVDQLRREPEKVPETVAKLEGDLSIAAEIAKLKTYFGDSPTMWIHIAELWDYVAIQPEKEAP